jgi:gliding motility-associated lipoprotein GldH
MNLHKKLYPFILLIVLVVNSCTTVDLFEKTTPIPGHKWKSSFKPSFTFDIKDTNRLYQIFFVLRHNEKYNFNNIYINLSAILPGQDSITVRKNLTLATNEKGWLATGMDDIYEHRLLLGEPEKLKAGTYTFTVEQVMREDPLENVLDAGIRIEKQ